MTSNDVILKEDRDDRAELAALKQKVTPNT